MTIFFSLDFSMINRNKNISDTSWHPWDIKLLIIF